MGRDIHMHIINGENITHRDIYEGRNYEWFDALQGNIYSDDSLTPYDFFPRNVGLPGIVPKEIKEDVASFGFYGAHYISVEDFCKWFADYKPHVHAGWVTTYEKFLYDERGFLPEYLRKNLTKEDVESDMHFIVVQDFEDPTYKIYDYICSNFVPSTHTIVYYFDC